MPRATAVLAVLGLVSCVRGGFDPPSSTGTRGDSARADLPADLRLERAAGERALDLGRLDRADLPPAPDRAGERPVDLPRGPDRDSAPSGKGAFLLFGTDGRRLVSFDQGTTWPVDQQDPTPSGTSDRYLMSAAWKAGAAVIVGGPWGAPGGFALRSTNGTTWTEVPLAGGQGPIGVAFGAGVFAALNNVGELHSSSDGLSWSFVGGKAEARSICYGQKRFFAAGDGGRISTSSDGLTWKTNTLGGSTLNAAVCGTDRFVAFGQGRRVTTLDGTTVLKDEAVSGLPAGGELDHGLGLFIDYAGSTSSDGLTWTPPPPLAYSFYSIAFGDGVFLATSKSANQVLRSSDAKSWQPLRALPSNPAAFVVRYVRFP